MAARTLKPCSFALALRLNRLTLIAIQFARSVSFMWIWNLLAITPFIIQVFYPFDHYVGGGLCYKGKKVNLNRHLQLKLVVSLDN